jgi:Plant transposon protein
MNRADAKRVVELHNHHHGVSKLIGSLDCMHIGWKNCPLAWHGQFKGKSEAPTIVFEPYCDFNLWVWHCAFGYAGTSNDINIRDQSPLLKSFIDGSFTKNVDFEYELGGQVFDKLWILIDGIYPECSGFTKKIEEPIGADKRMSSRWQDGCRKDVERAFGVVRRKF